VTGVVHVSVLAGGEHYALPVEGVLEVAEMTDVTPVPGAGAAILGVANLRGQVLPVVDLAVLLGLPTQRPPTRIVVVEQGDRRVGLAVETVTDVGVVADPTAVVASSLLRGANFVDGELVGVVDLGAMLAALVGEAGA
jgi:purine-binding chemotaxis protein CheW